MFHLLERPGAARPPDPCVNWQVIRCVFSPAGRAGRWTSSRSSSSTSWKSEKSPARRSPPTTTDQGHLAMCFTQNSKKKTKKPHRAHPPRKATLPCASRKAVRRVGRAPNDLLSNPNPLPNHPRPPKTSPEKSPKSPKNEPPPPAHILINF